MNITVYGYMPRADFYTDLSEYQDSISKQGYIILRDNHDRYENKKESGF